MSGTTRRDRAIGALLGLAVGDALGTTLEFTRRDAQAPLRDMVGGGPFGLAPGQWTDDTSMALCLADSLLASGGLDEADLMGRFVRWWRDGENSCTGDCFDIGDTVSAALGAFERDGIALAGSLDPWTAGNGSLMRLAPVALFWHDERPAAENATRRQSFTTHGAPVAVEACGFFAGLLVDAIDGAGKAEFLAPRRTNLSSEVAPVAGGSWKGKPRDRIKSSGYVVHTLEAAHWAVESAGDFEQAVLLAANLGDDADTVAAVTGQLAGAHWGASGIPERWKQRLAWRDHIEGLAWQLFDRLSR